MYYKWRRDRTLDQEFHLEHAIPLLPCHIQNVGVVSNRDAVKNIGTWRTIAFGEDEPKICIESKNSGVSY